MNIFPYFSNFVSRTVVLNPGIRAYAWLIPSLPLAGAHYRATRYVCLCVFTSYNSMEQSSNG